MINREKCIFYKFGLLFLSLVYAISASAQHNNNPRLKNDKLVLEWVKTPKGYHVSNLMFSRDGQHIIISKTSGEYTLIYSAEKPSSKPNWNQIDQNSRDFPEDSYNLLINRWKQNLDEVALNTAGEAIDFFPSHAIQHSEGEVSFRYSSAQAEVSSTWKLDPDYASDIIVEIELTAKADGYFSLASPLLAEIDESDVTWGTIPGHFQGNELQDNLVLGYGYGQGIPNRPVIVRERTASTLSPLVSSKQGFTLAVIPNPGTGRHPWEKDQITQNDWMLGLSLINRNKKITPTAYHPVLGEKNSYLKKGEKRNFGFRYSLAGSDWYEVYKHAINNIYHFPDVLKLKDTKQSLTNRIYGMLDYVRADSSSLWHIYNYKGIDIGAQEYNAKVIGRDNDAMKNSDYAAMWMLANITQDSVLINERLPYARNFKLAQQEIEDDFFRGAAIGQYYLWKAERFTEEWGNYVEPIALTYYTMLDIGNILLFEKDDSELQNRLRLGAERLLHWQHEDGSWEVAYDRDTKQPIFTDLQDLRPTFYGLLVAYKFFGDKKYLDAARKGADWFIQNAVDKGHFLGVCGDFRFVADFATGQSAQALLDLYDLTQEEKYKEAAIRTARIYTASIYTHPIPNNEDKTVNGTVRKDWEISQVGLSFEHGGTLGSAAKVNGPILLASHAGMFVRLFGLTKDQLYLDMARAAAWGRDAFVNQENSVASYYWNRMDNGPGRFPHHAWWQIGWITDYLLSEVTLRSKGKIDFPAGFITPKVGPHKTYGFAPGKIYGSDVELFLQEDFISINNQRIDFIGAVNKAAKESYIILLNNSTENQQFHIDVNHVTLFGEHAKVAKIELLNEEGEISNTVGSNDSAVVTISPFGLNTLKITYQ